MTNPNQIIRRFEKRSHQALITLSFLKGLVRAFSVFLVGFLIISVLDHWFEIPYWGRQSLWFGAMATAVAFFLSGFTPLRQFSLKAKSMQLYENSKKSDPSSLRSDELCLAVDLSRQPDQSGISIELRTIYLNEIAKKLDRYSAFLCCSTWLWRKALLWFLAVLLGCGTVWAFFPNQLPLSSRIFFPFGGVNLRDLVDVFPGDAQVPWGGKIEIKLVSKNKSLIKPVLYVRSKKDWFSLESQKDRKGVQVYVFEGIVEPLQYRVKMKKDWGQKYTITPSKPIQFDEIKITLQQPDYLGGTVVTQTSPEITGLPGSRVTFEASVNTPLRQARLLFSDGSEKKVDLLKGDKIKTRFSLYSGGTYGFYLETEEGAILENRTQYPIRVLEDQSPSVNLLSPESDLVVSPQEVIPLTFDAKDDFGLRQAFLFWSVNGGAKKKVPIKKFPYQTENVLETYEWDLRREDFKAGNLIQYKIQVEDGNSVTGPGLATTETRILEIQSFRKGHENLEEALEGWRDKVLELLAEVNTLKAKTEIESTNLEDVSKEFNESYKKSEYLEKILDQIVSAMEKDPLADYEVWLEHRAMSENFETMNQGGMRRTQAALQTKNQKVAAREMEQISAELERMLALSEELSKTQRARDIRDAGDDLSQLGEDLMKELEAASKNGSPLDNEQIRQINQMIQKAQEILSEMARSLLKFPEELPEDFVNQESLKSLDMQKSQDILSQINNAIKRGDMAEALKLAQQFLKMAEKMKEQVSEAHESYMESNSAEDLANDIAEKSSKLSVLTEKQRELLAETQKLESKRLKEVMELQEKLLEKLAMRQKKVSEQATVLVNDKAFALAPKKKVIALLRPIGRVLQEFESKRVQDSVKWLTEIIAGFVKTEEEMEPDVKLNEYRSKIEKMRKEEESILSELQKPIEPKKGYSKEEKEMFKQLASKQEKLSKETGSLKQALQKLSQRTANLGIALTQSLGDAAVSMQKAEGSLKGESSRAAQRHEESALRSLQKAQDALGQAQMALGEMASYQMEGSSGKGGRGGRPKVMMRGSNQGSHGQKIGRVRLPTAEDYRPPKAFREELLESLKEKYPDIYEDIIHKYFKRLSE